MIYDKDTNKQTTKPHKGYAVSLTNSVVKTEWPHIEESQLLSITLYKINSKGIKNSRVKHEMSKPPKESYKYRKDSIHSSFTNNKLKTGCQKPEMIFDQERKQSAKLKGSPLRESKPLSAIYLIEDQYWEHSKNWGGEWRKWTTQWNRLWIWTDSPQRTRHG